MKLLKLTTFYPSYLKDFYRRHPHLADKSFAEQKAALDYDAFGWADYWANALIPLGYDVMEITMNAYPMQRAWANENILIGENMDFKRIVLAQVKKFQPEILWFDDYEATLLKQLRAEVPSIRLVLGWAGSTILKSDVWHLADLVLSCAPESVEFFRKAGLKAEHMNHAFDPRINSRLTERFKNIDFSFIGQLIRSRDFHLVREQLLEQIAAQTGITIYSPSADLTLRDELRASVVAGVYDVLQFLKKVGISESALCNFPVIGNIARLKARPLSLVNPRLTPYIRQAVFGLEMFQVLHDSRITLNVHADTSTRYASNMRLFETTGVGTCLLTDWKENLFELFEPDIEVVSYRSAEDCVEKARWLLNHPKEREAIARAGQSRTMETHTFSNRALQLDELLKSMIKPLCHSHKIVGSEGMTR